MASSSRNAENRESELIEAIKANNYDLVETLLHIQKGRKTPNNNPNLLSTEKKAPMFYAVKNSNIRMIKLLLERKANFKKDSESLSLAVAESTIEVLKTLLQNGANPNVKSKGKPWTNAKRRKLDDDDDDIAFDVFDDYFCCGGIDFDDESAEGYDRQKRGRTPLHFAVELGHREAVNTLIDYGADVNCVTTKKLTPLILAAYKGHLELVQILLESNASIDFADAFKITALHAAAKSRRTLILNVLVNFCFNDIKLLLKTGIHRSPDARNACFANDSLLEQRGSVNIIVMHWLKILVAGLVTPDEQTTLLELAADSPALRSSIENNETYKNACALEVTRLKTELMGNSGFPYFDILTENEDQLAFLARNDEIVKVLKPINLETKFPIYGGLLQCQFRKGETRKNLLKKGTEVGQLLFSGFVLPDLVREKILKYLDNKDIKVFITTCLLCCDT